MEKHVFAECLKKGSSDEYAKEEFAEMYRKQLDEMEEKMCEYSRRHPFVGREQMAVLTAIYGSEKDAHMAYVMWFLNIAALLKLKKVESDNNTGWLIRKIVGNTATFIV